jgi:hypothetical protein
MVKVRRGGGIGSPKRPARTPVKQQAMFFHPDHEPFAKQPKHLGERSKLRRMLGIENAPRKDARNMRAARPVWLTGGERAFLMRRG